MYMVEGSPGGRRDNPGTHRFCQRLAQRGYVAVTMSYTLHMKGQSFGCDQSAANKINTFKLTALDVSRATAYILKNQKTLNINPNQIVLAGSSAGAEAILHAAYWQETWKDASAQILPNDFKYGGLISMAGAITDLRLINQESLIPMQFFHGTCDNLVPYAQAPHHYCPLEAPGFLTLYGAKAIVDKVKSLGGGYHLFTACNGNHSWAGKPMHDQFATIVDFLYHDVVNQRKRQIHTVYPSEQSACEEKYTIYSYCK